MASQRRDNDVSTLDLRHVVGENLRLAQRRAGLKNKDVTDSLDIDVGLLTKHKGGRVMPSPENLVKYGSLYEVPVSWFFDTREDEWKAA